MNSNSVSIVNSSREMPPGAYKYFLGIVCVCVCTCILATFNYFIYLEFTFVYILNIYILALVVKNPPASAGDLRDLGSIPESRLKIP